MHLIAGVLRGELLEKAAGEVLWAGALLGSDDRLEYTVVGDVVNLRQRLQEWVRPGEVVLSEPTLEALGGRLETEHLGPWPVKGAGSQSRPTGSGPRI